MNYSDVDMNNGWWELRGFDDYDRFFAGLRDWLPPGSLLCFQYGRPDAELEGFFARHSIPEQVCCGEHCRHVPATKEVFTELIAIMAHHVSPELADHVLVHRDRGTLLEWYDAFFNHLPMRLDISIPEERIKLLAELFGTEYTRESYGAG